MTAFRVIVAILGFSFFAEGATETVRFNRISSLVTGAFLFTLYFLSLGR